MGTFCFENEKSSAQYLDAKLALIRAWNSLKCASKQFTTGAVNFYSKFMLTILTTYSIWLITGKLGSNTWVGKSVKISLLKQFLNSSIFPMYTNTLIYINKNSHYYHGHL